MNQDLAAAVAELKAMEDIKRLKALYCLHCDDNYNPDELAKLFTEDAVWDNPLRGVFTGRKAIREFFAGASTAIPFSAHLITNPIIDVDLPAQTASGIWRMVQPGEMRSPEGGTHAVLQIVRYDEQYRKIDGSWLISHLKVGIRRLEMTGHWDGF